MRTLLLLPATAVLCGAQAQQIDGYRYWFDDDAASAVTTTVGATDELTLSTVWPTGSMAPGYHRVSFQFRDTNGEWSVPGTRQFVRGAHDIIGYRYWVNDDIGTLTTGSVGPAQTADLNALIDPGSLTRDYNTVTIQFRDADGEWSVPKTSVFVLNSGLVNGYQYWIDDDIANSQSGSIGPADVVDLIADLPTGVPNGNHLFTIRFSGANGSWSVPLTAEFSVILSTPELPGITDLLLFPNPATDQLGLRLTTDQARTLQLEVLDLSGAVVADLSSWSVSTTAHRSWDISALASGSYLLRITGEHGAWTTRFVKP
ncbi:MAG TPA: T9SS type A sorting domain-containing protein [Flavobacteriales bacterium]|nr:T9SS type A sorting domain-containing protein [Flavobacteriales bacterium]HMR28171.1 T9SS type A sorting domain-containing protein [Flavobacteriales bacterium]